MSLPNIPEGYPYIIASLTGGILVILSNRFNNYFQLNKAKEEWNRQQVFNAYEKCVFNLVKLAYMEKKCQSWGMLEYDEKTGKPNSYTGFLMDDETRKLVLDLLAEMQLYLQWVLNDYPTGNKCDCKDDYKKALQISQKWITEPPIKVENFLEIDEMRQLIIQLMREDSRIHIK